MSEEYLPINLMNVTAASSGFDYPNGKYLFEVIDSEVKTNTDGEGKRLVTDNVILMGPGAGNTQFQNQKMPGSYQLSDKGAQFLKRFFLVCGITEEFIQANGGNVNKEWLKKRQFVGTIGKNKEGYCNINNERPASEWNKLEVPRTAAPTASGPPSSLLQPNPAAQMPTPMSYVQPPMMMQPPMQQQQMMQQPPMPQQMQQMQQPQYAQQQMQLPQYVQQQPQPQYAQPSMPAPQALPTPQMPPQQMGVFPAPVPPPGSVGQR